MAFHKCPRCELNYITDGEKLCSVCRREVKGEHDRDAMPELCTECGERPAVPGSEYCLLCLKEMGRRSAETAHSDTEEHAVETSPLGIDMVSTMDEIQIDDIDDDDIPPREFDEMESAFGSDDDDEDEEQDEDEDDESGAEGRRRPRKGEGGDN